MFVYFCKIFNFLLVSNNFGKNNKTFIPPQGKLCAINFWKREKLPNTRVVISWDTLDFEETIKYIFENIIDKCYIYLLLLFHYTSIMQTWAFPIKLRSVPTYDNPCTELEFEYHFSMLLDYRSHFLVFHPYLRLLCTNMVSFFENLSFLCLASNLCYLLLSFQLFRNFINTPYDFWLLLITKMQFSQQLRRVTTACYS